MENEIKVSLITVCLNSEKTIRQTIESVLTQTYINYEYIIIDGGSSDNTLNILEEYREKFGNKYTIVSEKDNGLYDAMNKGIRISKGEIIGIINSDDFYEKNTLEQVVLNWGKYKYQVLYGMIRILENNLEKSVLLYSHHFLKEQMICHPGCFVSRKIYLDYGMYNTNYISAADYEFMLRITRKNNIIFKPVYSIFANFRIGGMCDSTIGCLDSLRVKRDYGLINRKEYIVNFIKIKYLRK